MCAGHRVPVVVRELCALRSGGPARHLPSLLALALAWCTGAHAAASSFGSVAGRTQGAAAGEQAGSARCVRRKYTERCDVHGRVRGPCGDHGSGSKSLAGSLMAHLCGGWVWSLARGVRWRGRRAGRWWLGKEQDRAEEEGVLEATRGFTRVRERCSHPPRPTRRPRADWALPGPLNAHSHAGARWTARCDLRGRILPAASAAHDPRRVTKVRA